VAVFNLGSADENINLRWQDLGIEFSLARVRDLWQHTALGASDGLHARLRPHACVLYAVQP